MTITGHKSECEYEPDLDPKNDFSERVLTFSVGVLRCDRHRLSSSKVPIVKYGYSNSKAQCDAFAV